MRPLFSATKTRPSVAKRILVGLVRPVKTVESTNPAASVGPASGFTERGLVGVVLVANSPGAVGAGGAAASTGAGMGTATPARSPVRTATAEAIAARRWRSGERRADMPELPDDDDAGACGSGRSMMTGAPYHRRMDSGT